MIRDDGQCTEYQSNLEVARAYGLSEGTIGRILADLEARVIGEARLQKASEFSRRRGQKPVTVIHEDGRRTEHPSGKSVARAYKVTPNVVNIEVRRRGVRIIPESTLLDAAARLAERRRPLVIHGEWYASAYHACRALGVKRAPLNRRRIRYPEWTIEQAFEAILARRRKLRRKRRAKPVMRRRIKDVTAFGLRFRSFNAACVYFDVRQDPSYLRKRYFEGVPFEQLFSHGRLALRQLGLWDEKHGRRRDEDELPASALPIEDTNAR